MKDVIMIIIAIEILKLKLMLAKVFKNPKDLRILKEKNNKKF